MTEKPNQVIIENGNQIPPDWGTPQEAKRKTTVTIREPEGQETFEVAGGILTARPGLDWIIIQPSGEEYPIKKEIFTATYEEVTAGHYRKTARSRLVQVPEEVIAVLVTKEGRIEVQHPDYVAIGKENEVYGNSAQWVKENLLLL
jgi:hypothetical protein